MNATAESASATTRKRNDVWMLRHQLFMHWVGRLPLAFLSARRRKRGPAGLNGVSPDVGARDREEGRVSCHVARLVGRVDGPGRAGQLALRGEVLGEEEGGDEVLLVGDLEQPEGIGHMLAS